MADASTENVKSICSHLSFKYLSVIAIKNRLSALDGSFLWNDRDSYLYARKLSTMIESDRSGTRSQLSFYFVSNWTPFVIWDLSDDLLSLFESSWSYLMIKVIVLFSCPLTHSTWLQLSIRINKDWPSQTIAMGKNAPWANSFERNCIVQQIWRF